jgi:hypothetical protein
MMEKKSRLLAVMGAGEACTLKQYYTSLEFHA